MGMRYASSRTCTNGCEVSSPPPSSIHNQQSKFSINSQSLRRKSGKFEAAVIAVDPLTRKLERSCIECAGKSVGGTGEETGWGRTRFLSCQLLSKISVDSKTPLF